MSQFVQSLDSILTSQWSNIPACVVLSINILSEGIRLHHTQLESLRTQLTDLSLKVSVKTGRYDASIEDLHSSFKSFNADSFKKIESLQTSCKDLKENIDSKVKSVSDAVNEVKGRVSILTNDFRKENREFCNKIEKIKNEANDVYVENLARANKRIDESSQGIAQRFELCQKEIFGTIEENKEKIKEIGLVIRRFEDKLVDQSLVIEQQRAYAEKSNIQSIIAVKKIEKVKKKLKTTAKRVESFSQPMESIFESPNSESSPVSPAYPNPFFDRISQLEQKFEFFMGDSRRKEENLAFQFNCDLKNLQSDLEIWTHCQISKYIQDSLLPINKKLEWMPNDGEKIKEMSVTEARLFLLEARIKEEEKARIMFDQKLENHIIDFKKGGIERPAHKVTRSNFTPVEEKSAKFEKHHIKVKKRPNSSLGHRDLGYFMKPGLREKFSIKV